MAPHENISFLFMKGNSPALSKCFDGQSWERTLIFSLVVFRIQISQSNLGSWSLVHISDGRVFTVAPSSGLPFCIQINVTWPLCIFPCKIIVAKNLKCINCWSFTVLMFRPWKTLEERILMIQTKDLKRFVQNVPRLYYSSHLDSSSLISKARKPECSKKVCCPGRAWWWLFLSILTNLNFVVIL